MLRRILQSTKKYLPLILGLVFAVVFALHATQAIAETEPPIEKPSGIAAYIGDTFTNSMIGVINVVTTSISAMLALLITIVMSIMIGVAQYNHFATSPAIELGWKMVRDLANMGIVVGLLYIAFATAINKAGYTINKALQNFVIGAVLVNFSKSLTLFAVDVSQVVMMTFVNAFRTIGTGNLIKILGIENFFQLAKTQTDFSTTTAMAGAFFMIIILLIVLMVLVIMALILIWRIVMIWIYVVLSPLAFASIAIAVPAIITNALIIPFTI